MRKKAFIMLVLFAVLVAGILTARDASQLYLYAPEFTGSYTYNIMFNSGLWALLYSVGLGISLGAVAARFLRGRAETKAREVVRRGAGVFFEDLGAAFCILGGFILLVTGIIMGGFLSPRLLVETPEAVGFVMNMHFVGIVTLLFGFGYFVTRTIVSGDYSLVLSLKDIFRPQWQGKYLPSLRWAMLTFAVVFIALGVKGSGLLAEQVLGLPKAIAIGASISHDILGLVGIIPALVTVSLMIKESLGKQGQVVSKPSEVKA